MLYSVNNKSLQDGIDQTIEGIKTFTSLFKAHNGIDISGNLDMSGNINLHSGKIINGNINGNLIGKKSDNTNENVITNTTHDGTTFTPAVFQR